MERLAVGTVRSTSTNATSATMPPPGASRMLAEITPPEHTAIGLGLRSR